MSMTSCVESDVILLWVPGFVSSLERTGFHWHAHCVNVLHGSILYGVSSIVTGFNVG